MLTIRLFRIGRKNQPSFKIVVTEKQKSSTRGRFVEEVGFYNPLTKQRNIKGDRVKYWISVGAKPSATVHNMLVTDKVLDAPKIAKHKLIESEDSSESERPVPPKAEEKPVESQQAVPETPKETEEPKEAKKE